MLHESDKRVQQYGLQYTFASSYIIGSGWDESVSCPFIRGGTEETHKIDQIGNEIKQASLSKED